MNINTKFTGFEKLLKDKLGNYEYPYNNKDWNDFERKLPRSTEPFISPKTVVKYLVIAAAVIIPIVTILYFNNNSNSKVDKNTVAVSNDKNAYQNKSLNDNLNTANNQPEQKANNNTKNNSTALISDNNSKDNKTSVNAGNKQDNIKKDNATIDNSSNNSGNNNSVSSQNPVNNVTNYGYITADVTDGCAPLNVKFTPAVISDTISYQWSFGDGKKSTKKTPSNTYTKAGTFTVTLSVKFKKSGLTTIVHMPDYITVKAAAVAKFSYKADNITDVYTFTDNSINASTWNWSLGDKATSKEQNPDHEYMLDGTYTVKLIAMNLEGCSDAYTANITVKNKPPFYLPTGFSLADGPDDFGPEGADMNADGYKFIIYDKSGKIVFETTSLDEKWDGKIKGTNTDAPTGAYVCKITMKNKHGILRDWPFTSVTLMR